MHFFYLLRGASPLDTHLCLFNGKGSIIVLATASNIGKVGGIDMRIPHISLEMNNSFLSFSGGHISPSDTPLVIALISWFQPNSFEEVYFLEESYDNMQKIQILKTLRASSIRHQGVCLKYDVFHKRVIFNGGWGRNSSTLLQGAKLNDSLGPRVCASWTRPWYLTIHENAIYILKMWYGYTI